MRFSIICARYCGKAYEGKVAVDNPASPGFEGRLVMHVRKCTDTQLQIPFHVGDNHSRTWIITKTGSGLSLKHDHRHEDGSSDTSTMYGGHTLDAGWAQRAVVPGRPVFEGTVRRRRQSAVKRQHLADVCVPGKIQLPAGARRPRIPR